MTRHLAASAALLLLSGCLFSHRGPKAAGEEEEGYASYYAKSFEGKKTASGEPYRGEAMTCAHRTLPFGSVVEVTLLSSGKHVVVRVNDRGPFVEGRIVDLSYRAARELGLLQRGAARVRLRVVTPGRAR